MKKITVLLSLLLFAIISYAGVINKNEPANGKWDLNKKLLWEVESAGNEVFGDIQNVVTSKDDRIFVADMKNSLIFIFNKDGKFVRSFGKRGEGPGEIREYFGGNLFQVVNDQVIFADRTMFHYFDIDGNYIKTTKFSPRLKPREFVNGDIFISAPVTIDRRGAEFEKILLYNLKTEKKTEIASFKPFDKATDTQESGGNQITVGIVIGDITPMMLVRFKDGKLYYGMNSKNELNVCDLNGKNILTFSNLLKKPNKVSDNYKNDLKARLGDVPPNMLKNIINGLPPNASFFSDVFVDQKGNIYLFESDPDSTTKKIIDIYSPEGKFIYKSEIRSENDEEIQLIHMNNDSLLLVTEDEEGNIIVSKYKIELPN
ncbi:MAG: 6-bladed beta-propeller [Candidatus Aminicenantes bacterium]|nr:6-bladed beta-propeller [Candidatus Aminicenantes bacterium]